MMMSDVSVTGDQDATLDATSTFQISDVAQLTAFSKV
jgi:hypothetical protein